ncbi:MAG: G-D-S-L family lipolytic protein, partial [Bergeyella zoohelcum]|nr:G-D-S-L family lipolytic protein [Bergeyella zoohelcum]
MKKIFFSAIAISTLFFSYSCNTDFDTDVTEIATTNGEADFSKYVALGNSLTAGYRDNALYISGQNESYPNMIAQQMKAVGGGEFKQPLMADDLGGIPSIGRANKLVLSLVNGELSPVTASGTGTTTLTNIYASGPYQNMGVPGAKVSHLLAPGYGSAANLSAGRANPYFVRFASSATTSVIADFISQKPTFFSLWIGNNDALLYALAGGDSSVETLTSAADFKTYYTLLATQIATTGAKGIVANIPDVTAIPSLTTVPYNPLSVSVLGSDNIDKLNQRIYGPLKQVLTALGAGDRINLLSKT